jgi:precorrin-6B methylase 2
MYMQMLHVAVKLGIPDLLVSGPRSADELTRASGSNARSLYRVLRALCDTGLLAEDSVHRFSLTPDSQALRSDVPYSVRAMVLAYGSQSWWHAWGNLVDAARTGECAFDLTHGMGVFDYDREYPEQGAIVRQYMMQMGGGQFHQMAAAAYDFSSMRLLVDVGGGHGGLLIAILKANPALRGILIDLPEVASGASRNIEAAGLTDRCEVHAGDFFESVPAGGDVYILSNILHDWDDARALAILKKCRAAMSRTAKLLINEAIMPEDGSASFVKLVDVQMLAIVGGQQRTRAEYASLLEAADLRLHRVLPVGSRGGALVEAVPV